MKKKNFRFNDFVRIVKTNSNLDGLECRILGKSFENIIDSYIVELPKPIKDSNGYLYQAITMTEACLVLTERAT